MPYGDLKKHINVLLKRKGSLSGMRQKTRNYIYPQLGLLPGGSQITRHEESVLARIRIGHTHLTHCLRLKEEDSPQCIACDSHLTAKHFI